MCLLVKIYGPIFKERIFTLILLCGLHTLSPKYIIIFYLVSGRILLSSKLGGVLQGGKGLGSSELIGLILFHCLSCQSKRNRDNRNSSAAICKTVYFPWMFQSLVDMSIGPHFAIVDDLFYMRCLFSPCYRVFWIIPNSIWMKINALVSSDGCFVLFTKLWLTLFFPKPTIWVPQSMFEQNVKNIISKQKPHRNKVWSALSLPSLNHQLNQSLDSLKSRSFRKWVSV